MAYIYQVKLPDNNVYDIHASITDFFNVNDIVESTDLNSVTKPGMYKCIKNATVKTLINCPTSNAFTMLVEQHAGYRQTLTEYMSGNHRIYERNYYSGTWGNWCQVYTTINPPTSVSGNAGTATKLQNLRTIDGIQFDGSSNISHYGTCSTAAATVAKVATVDSSFVLEPGAMVNIKMQYANGVANPTLNVNGTGAIAIKRYGTTAPSTSATSSWNANAIVQFIYDGTYWYIQGWLNNNTTYSAATQTANGLMSSTDKKKLDELDVSKVEQTSVSGDIDLRLLLSYDENDDTEIENVYKSSKFTANPTKGILKAPKFLGELDDDSTFHFPNSADVEDGKSTEWTSVGKLDDGVSLKADTFLYKITQMFKNIRYLYSVISRMTKNSGDGLNGYSGLTLRDKIYIYGTGDNDLGIRFTKEDGSYKYWVFYKDTDMLKISGTSIFRWKSTVGKMLTGKTTSVDISEYPDASEFLIIAHPGTATSITYSILVPKVALSATAQLFRSGHYQNGSNGGMVTYSCTSSTISMDNVFLNSSDVSSSSTWTVYWR